MNDTSEFEHTLVLAAIRHEIVRPCPHMELAKSALTALLLQHGLYSPLRGQPNALGSKIPFRNW